MHIQNPGKLLMDLAEEAAMMPILYPGRNGATRKWPKPGQFIENLPPEIREVLTKLKSADIKGARWQAFFANR